MFDALTRRVPDDAVIAVDVGNNTYSFGRYFECTRQSVLMSGYLGSIGFGYPAAMGAWAAAPDRPIVAVTGDGGFGQYLAELTTAVKYGMDITHVLLEQLRSSARSRKEQRAAELRDVWQTSLHNPDFAEYARLVRRARHPRDPAPTSSTPRSRRASPTTARRSSRSSPTPTWSSDRFYKMGASWPSGSGRSRPVARQTSTRSSAGQRSRRT